MASLRWNNLSTACRVLSVAGTSTGLALFNKDETNGNETSPFVQANRQDTIPSTYFQKMNGISNILRMSPAKTAMEAAPIMASPTGTTDSSPETTTTTTDKTKVKDYDFVVIGHGLAGKSAVKKLQELCPQASIAVLDNRIKTEKTNGKVHYLPFHCDGFHPLKRTVKTSKGEQLRYQHAILVATGSRGAPPPHYLLDEKALGRILELRPTVLATTQQDKGRPIWDPAFIRRKVLHAARKGDKVATVGSGWEAVELAIAASVAGQSKRHSSSALVFGGKGPLSHVLPQYLSAAVAKRLTSTRHNIEIYHRSLIRYVGTDYTASNVDGDLAGLTLYTAKSYDLLDAARTSVQWLVGKWPVLLLNNSTRHLLMTTCVV